MSYSKDELFYCASDWLKGLIAIPSVSRDEAQAADFLAAELARIGIPIRRKGNNLWSIAPGFDPGQPTLLLNSHIDTVKPTAQWTRPPFTPTEEEGRIYGLGSNDAGASLVSLLSSFIYLRDTRQPYNLIFLASAEEEVSGLQGISSVLPELPPIDFAIVGEPTGMHPAIAEKGLMVLDCTVYGVAGHAARNEGINAIYKALPILEQLRTFEFPETSGLLGAVRLSVTQIEAGTQHNVIPDRCRFTIDLRTNDRYSNSEALEWLKKHFDLEITPRSTRLNSSRLDPRHPFVTRAVVLGRTPFGSPTLSDQALMPFPSVKIGPGDSARSHTADEYVAWDEIREAIEMYISLLDGLKIPKINE